MAGKAKELGPLLSAPALKLLKALPRMAGSEVVFSAPRGGPLSDMTLTAVLRRMKVAAVPHGFRSTFRDWASEPRSYPRDAAEMALAYAIGDKVEAAYRRGDLFEKRRRMMADWATFCGQPLLGQGVTPMFRKVDEPPWPLRPAALAQTAMAVLRGVGCQLF